MNNPGVSQKRRKTGFFNLNRQFCLIVFLGVVISFIMLIVIISVAEPIVSKRSPWIENINISLSVLGKELYNIADDPAWSLAMEEQVDEIEKIIEKYPQYKFYYEVLLDIDRETFELQGLISETKISAESYAVIILEANNGIAVVGVIVPEITRFASWISILSISLFMIVLLIIIGIFASRKVRYLKKIIRNLEIIAGGDLRVKIPLRGRDEIYQVAYHINEMASALQNEMEKAKEIEETKKQLITNISHDLRTPLTAILGFLGILESMDLESNTDKAKQYIHRAYEKSNRLSRLVDQLFDYVLISNQQMNFNLEKVEPSLYFMQVISEMENLLDPKQIEVVYTMESSEHSIHIDCIQFKRVIENLMQNLQKYARVNSQVEVEGFVYENNYILSVSNDSLEGLEASNDFLSRYFTTDRSTGKSAGLGLAICKELVEHQKGSFMVEVNQDRFRTIITLPCGE